MRERIEPTYLLKSEIRDFIEGNHPSIRILRYLVYSLALLLVANVPGIIANDFPGEVVIALLQLLGFTVAVVGYRRWRMFRLLKRDVTRDMQWWRRRR